MSFRPRQPNCGFTLIEMIMVIVITGILAGIVAVFITKPVQGYADSVRRAELTDAADVALRRMTRDVRLALPNSLRVMNSGGTYYVEFIITSGGGRYRADGDGSTGGAILDFTSGSTSFDVLGLAPTITTGDYIVVFNLGEGHVPENAYVAADPCTNCNRAKVTTGGSTVTLASNPFASQSPDNRFQVVPGNERAVTFACPETTSGNLTRHWNYGFNASQAAPSGGGSATLAGGATCTVEFTNDTVRTGLLYIRLTLTDTPSGESVTLFQQIHVDNAP